ncbi:hypothetical protein MIND_01128000 [Mycena indigotica]|uniref:Uncharacterized protein n=1 Tax=Mycena indigotica TaxID=2126181 RepID=A0A8H6S900_9AGAR|nr:uncharacterized protein MIND_01128000 [Mycena indigotica]KAF7293500.1 hypothetical protein MIND_01128000 [Mycena indigotica]
MDKQFVNNDLLRDLLNEEGPLERVRSGSVGSDPDSDPRPTGTKQKSFPKLTHSDRALCRILYHEHNWRLDLVAEAFGQSRPGGKSPLYKAVKNIPSAKGSDIDDPSRDHEFVNKARLAELLVRSHSPSTHPHRRSTSRAKAPRFKPYERSPGKQGKTMHASGKNAADRSQPDPFDCPPRSHHARDADSDRLSPSNSSFRRTGHVGSRAASLEKYPTASSQMPSLFEFLANIGPEIDLSDRHSLFIDRGIDTIAKLRAMKSWDKEDLHGALSDWFHDKVTVKSGKYTPLNDYELVALRQAIQKL